MKALRSPAALIGLVALAVVLVSIVFLRGSGKVDGGTEPVASGETAQREEQTLPDKEATASTSATDDLRRGKAVQANSLQWEVLEKLQEQALSGKLITKEDAERFLREKGVTPMNLLAVATATGDKAFIRRAAAQFPDHPAVQLAVLGENLFPEARAEWIARFKTSSPDNPLPFLFSASDAVEQKDLATALSETSLAVEKPGLYLWSSEFMEATRQMFESKGYTPVEAELLSTFSPPINYLADFNKLGRELLQWREQAVKEGNAAGAAEAVRVTYGMGRMFQSPEGSRTFITQLIGIALESRALSTLPPGEQPAFLETPRAQRESEMQRLKEIIRGSQTDTAVLMLNRDPALLAGYLQRIRNEGEYQALLWLKEQTK